MKKKTKYIMAALAAILIIAAVILAVKVRNSIPETDGLIIQADGKTFTLSWEDLNQRVFTGEIVNGKGEVSNHEYRGAELYELLKASDIEVKADSKITAISEDNYTAELTGSEIMTDDKVYAAVMYDDEMIESIDGAQGAQLVVYGDSNAKRQVRYLKTIKIE